MDLDLLLRGRPRLFRSLRIGSDVSPVFCVRPPIAGLVREKRGAEGRCTGRLSALLTLAFAATDNIRMAVRRTNLDLPAAAPAGAFVE